MIVCSTAFPHVAVYVGPTPQRANWIIPPGSVRSPIPTEYGFGILDRFTSQLTYPVDERLDEHGSALPHAWVTEDDEMGRSS